LLTSVSPASIASAPALPVPSTIWPPLMLGRAIDIYDQWSATGFIETKGVLALME